MNPDMELEEHFSDLARRMGGTPDLPYGTAEQVVSALESAWRADEPRNLAISTNWAAAFLACPKVSAEVWNWLVDKAKVANLDERSALVVGVFSLLAEPPIDNAWLTQLYTLLEDPKLRWVFLRLYDQRAKDFYLDLERVEHIKLGYYK